MGLSFTIYKILLNFSLFLERKPSTGNPKKWYGKFRFKYLCSEGRTSFPKTHQSTGANRAIWFLRGITTFSLYKWEALLGFKFSYCYCNFQMEMDVLICFYQSVQKTIARKVLFMFTPVAGWVVMLLIRIRRSQKCCPVTIGFMSYLKYRIFHILNLISIWVDANGDVRRLINRWNLIGIMMYT